MGDLPSVDVIRRDVADLEAACLPAREADVARELAGLLANYDLPKDTTPAIAAVRTKALQRTLDGVPLDIVQAGLAQVLLDCPWWPKPADVHKRIVGELGARKRALSKAKVALAMAARNARPSGWTPPSEADRNAVSEMVASVSDGFRMTVGRAA